MSSEAGSRTGTGTTYVVVDGENIDATLGTAILGARPAPDQRPRWERVLAFAQQQWGQDVKGLFFLNASNGSLPMSFVQALLAIGFQPIPLSGEAHEKVVELAPGGVAFDAIVAAQKSSLAAVETAHGEGRVTKSELIGAQLALARARLDWAIKEARPALAIAIRQEIVALAEQNERIARMQYEAGTVPVTAVGLNVTAEWRAHDREQADEADEDDEDDEGTDADDVDDVDARAPADTEG